MTATEIRKEAVMAAEVSPKQLRVSIESVILVVRGEKVLLDSDLAAIYGVATGALNRAVKRNLDRFPEDFVFQLTTEEVSALKCQSGISKEEARLGHVRGGRGGRRYLPYAFTEHGALMAANVLNSPHAVQMSVLVVRAYIRMRQAMATHGQMAEKLAELERRMTGHDETIRSLVQTIRQLMAAPEKPRRAIGFTPSVSRRFKVEERRPVYGRRRRKVSKAP
jgi:hypothetical protein